ncbi:MAG TPA: nucleotidyltransferase domain-containing protein [Treponemataceae bacterium]|nr:nucleotidyltransferase domain-containing protein [Treponemataceae bacterium]
MKILDKNIDEIIRLCETNTVRSLFAFGSITTDKFKPNSDIDLIVDIDDNDPISYSEKYFNLKFELEEILKREIDLLEQKAIRNKYFKNKIDRTKVKIYGKGHTNMA